MAEEQTTAENGGRVTQRDLYTAIQDLRRENKQDLKDMKEELLKALQETLSEFRLYRQQHAEQHESLDRTGTQALSAHLQAEATSEARSKGARDAAFGTLRFLNSNWKFFLILSAALLAALNRIDIDALIE